MAFDKLSVIALSMFFAADLFAMVALALPKWLETNLGGVDASVGLLYTCLRLKSRDQLCALHDHLLPSWLFTFILILGGIIFLNITLALLVASHWRPRNAKAARWTGFVTMLLFCLAAILFPVGFGMEQVGGYAYNLPSSFQVGISYIFFVMAQWLTIVSELFAAKVCVSRF